MLTGHYKIVYKAPFTGELVTIKIVYKALINYKLDTIFVVSSRCFLTGWYTIL